LIAAANEEPAKATGPRAFHKKSLNFCASVGATYVSKELIGVSVVELDGIAVKAEEVDESAGVLPSSTDADWARPVPGANRKIAKKNKPLRKRGIITPHTVYLKVHCKPLGTKQHTTDLTLGQGIRS
jgi:hypothetical protein